MPFFVRTSQEVSLNVNTFKIKNSDCKKLLSVKFDSKPTFDQHITDLCRRTSRKNTRTSQSDTFYEFIKATFANELPF